jgi:hypothetical protein
MGDDGLGSRRATDRGSSAEPADRQRAISPVEDPRAGVPNRLLSTGSGDAVDFPNDSLSPQAKYPTAIKEWSGIDLSDMHNVPDRRHG